MERESELIRRRMHAKRQAVKDKLHTLERTVLGTVEDAATLATDTVENVKETVEETVESVTHALDPRPRVRRHPAAAMAGSLVSGFLVGCLVPPLLRRKEPEAAPTRTPTTNGAHGPNGSSNGKRAEKTEKSSGFSAWGLLTSVIGPGLEMFKSKALKETSSLIRDVIEASVPEEYRPKATEFINKAVTSLGGEPLGAANRDGPAKQSEGVTDEQREFNEMGRPVGPAQGPHQRGLGKYNG